ncbi:MAG: helix-turn-helix transcriptional regulator [Spirochaetes bacterium]|nr:helix-turn-helix transcriptional regulator [Spirochaetota bacterium]
MPQVPLGQPPGLVKVGYSPTGFRGTEIARRDGFWQFHLYLYEGALRERDAWLSFAPGWMSLTPPSIAHEVRRPRRSPHYFVHFRPSGNPSASFPRLWLPMQSPDSSTAIIARLVGESLLHPERSRSRFWEFLWRLTETPTSPGKADLPRGLEAAMHYLEQDLETRRPVAFLAQRLGLSQGHLIRLFKKHFDLTPAAWRRRRLAERARMMLQESHLSPAQVAETLGVRDLQRFNKLMRREFGAAPRELRKRGR